MDYGEPVYFLLGMTMGILLTLIAAALGLLEDDRKKWR